MIHILLLQVTNDLSATLGNYGLAGATILIFYLLMRNELNHLRETIEKLNENIINLIITIKSRGEKDER